MEMDSFSTYLCLQPQNVAVADRFFESSMQSSAGVSVSASSAKTYSSVWEALQIISGDIARVALNLFYRGPQGRINRNDLPVWELLNRRAAGFMTSYTLRETMQQQALLLGNSYAHIVRDQTLRPLSLVLLDPTKTIPYVDESGEVQYRSRQYGRDIPSGDIFHLRGLGDDGLMGISVVSLARTSWGLGMAAEQHGASTFKNGARPDLVIETAARLNKAEADQLLDQWERRHGGADGRSRPALIGGGMKVTPFPISNEDAQWLQSRAFQRVEVASWFCLPPHKLGDSSRAGYNGVEAEERSYVNQTLMRWFVRWQTEANEKLLTEREKRERAYWEHNVEALVQGDFTTQTAMLVNLTSSMLMTRNEARTILNLPKVPGGDEFINPNTTSSNTQSAQQSVAIGPLKALLADRVSQFCRTESSQLANCVKSKDVYAAIDRLYGQLQGKLSSAIKPILSLIEASCGIKADCDTLAEDHCDTSKQLASEALTKGTPVEMLKAELSEITKDWHETRAAAMVSAVFGDDD